MTLQQLLYPFAKRFIAGENLLQAEKAIGRLIRRRFLVSVDILGEDVHEARQANSAKDDYLELLDKAPSLTDELDVSVKLSLLGLGIDKGLCKELLETILEKARGHTIRIDMEGSASTQATLDMLKDVQPNHKNLGQAVQAYLFRSQDDVQELLQLGVSIRLCKGAYREDSSIAFQSMDDIRKNFLALAQPILINGVNPAIATHDEFLLMEILKFVKEENIPADSFFFEMLYGVRRDLQKQLRDGGYRVRIYVPYGRAWLPYTLRRITERKENLIFVLKNIFNPSSSSEPRIFNT